MMGILNGNVGQSPSGGLQGFGLKLNNLSAIEADEVIVVGSF